MNGWLHDADWWVRYAISGTAVVLAFIIYVAVVPLDREKWNSAALRRLRRARRVRIVVALWYVLLIWLLALNAVFS